MFISPVVQHVCKQFSGNSRSELTNIDGKACHSIPEAVNKLALSARLTHSCDTSEINMIPLIFLNTAQSSITG
jgi:hypothetical protein